MKRINIVGLILALIFPVEALIAQGSLVSAPELAKMSRDKNVVIVSGRTLTDYKKVHISGAVHLDHNSLYKDGPVKNMLKSPKEIASILGSKGISDSKTIVLYDDGSGKYAGRLYWILDYMRAKDVRILDGHINAWKASRKPVTRNPSSAQKAIFTANPDNTKLATIAKVKSLGSAVLVDCRSAEEFTGKLAKDVRKGHIPGAINLEYKDVMDANGKLKTADVLTKMFKSKGVSSDKEVILYCESGVRAGIVYFALTSVLKYKKVKIFDGAYLEWSASNNKVLL
ncbi:MAG: sulfurtransferase [Cyclobacteriaceae bacterium]